MTPAYSLTLSSKQGKLVNISEDYFLFCFIFCFLKKMIKNLANFLTLKNTCKVVITCYVFIK